MEAFAAIFQQLYTSFVLRDFVGKIIPSSFLFFSLSILFIHPFSTLKALGGRISVILIFLITGLSWSIMLGLQGLAEALTLWSYVPKEAGSEIESQKVIQAFLRIACKSEQLQYERYVVIKEATGNLFIAGLLSLPSWILFFSYEFLQKDLKSQALVGWFSIIRTILVVVFSITTLISLHIMNVDHIKKQYGFAKEMLEQPHHTCNPLERKEEEKK